jgi:hypothetical protein
MSLSTSDFVNDLNLAINACKAARAYAPTAPSGFSFDSIDAVAVHLTRLLNAMITPPVVVTPPPVTPAQPPAFVKRDATNTGPILPLLTTHAGDFHATVPNQRITDILINGTLYIEAPGVTISNFKINAMGNDYGIVVITPKGTASDPSGPSVTATDGEVTNAMSGGLFGSNWHAQRLHLHDMGSDASDAGWNCSLVDSFIERIGMTATSHADGIQCVNGQNILISGNTFSMPYGVPGFHPNSCIFLEPPAGNIIANVTITGNWIDGGNYDIYAAGPGVSGISVTGNIFAKDAQYGYTYSSTKSQCQTWANNVDTNGVPV